MGKGHDCKTHEQFVDELIKVSPHIEVLGTYKKAKEKVLVKCKKHNIEFSSTPDNLLHGAGCIECGHEKRSKSKKKNFSEIENEFISRGITLLSTEDEIKSLKIDRLRYLCPIHGEQTILWNNFQKGAGCRKCADEENIIRTRMKTWDRIQDYFKNSEYKLISSFDEYTGAKDSCLRCLCAKHGEFYISWNNLNKFEGCPVCNSSSGERRIFSYLKSNNIEFKHPYRFDDLVGTGGKKLSYDFYIPDYKVLIEYQGEQHAGPVTFNCPDLKKAEDNFIKQQEHDRRKKDYAAQHDYELLEIWYYDFKNIETILDQEFKI